MEGVLSVVFPSITKSMNNKLICPVTTQEVKSAVFGMGALTAPGPDGFLRFFLSETLGDY